MKIKRILPLIVSIGAGMIIFALVGWRQGLFTATEPAEIYRYLCDAFFVPAAILICLGLLTFSAYGGFYDIFAYGASRVKHLFLPLFGRDKPEKQSYYEYHSQKAEKRQKPKYYTLKAGLGFLLLALVCLILFYTAQ